MLGVCIIIVMIIHRPGPEEFQYQNEKVVFSGGDGSSQDSPIQMEGVESTDGGFFAEIYWIQKHYPKFWVEFHEICSYGEKKENRYVTCKVNGQDIPIYVGDLPPHRNIYDCYSIKSKRGQEKNVWFLATNVYGKPIKNADLRIFVERLVTVVAQPGVNVGILRHMICSTIVLQQFPAHPDKPRPPKGIGKDSSEEEMEKIFSESVGDYIDKLTGISFPKEIEMLKRTRIRNPKDERNLSVSYSSPGIELSIFLYDRGLETIPNGIESEIVQNEYSSTLKTLTSQKLKGIYKDVQLTSEDLFHCDVDSVRLTFLRALVTVRTHEKEGSSFLLLRGQRGNFLKIRLSWDAGLPEGERHATKILNSIAGIIGARTLAKPALR